MSELGKSDALIKEALALFDGVTLSIKRRWWTGRPITRERADRIFEAITRRSQRRIKKGLEQL